MKNMYNFLLAISLTIFPIKEIHFYENCKNMLAIEKFSSEEITPSYSPLLKEKKERKTLNFTLIEENILDNLKGKTHTFRKENQGKEMNYSEDFNFQKDSLCENQLQAINIMLENLKYEKFREEIGDLIINDLKDPYKEWGGIIKLYPKGKLKFVPLESLVINPENKIIDSKNTNNYYSPAKDIEGMDYFAEFHLHADTLENSAFAGPGPLDLMIQDSKLYKKNYLHEFVITSLKKGEFNIDYYGSDKKVGKKISVIDLGNYSY